MSGAISCSRKHNVNGRQMSIPKSAKACAAFMVAGYLSFAPACYLADQPLVADLAPMHDFGEAVAFSLQASATATTVVALHVPDAILADCTYMVVPPLETAIVQASTASTVSAAPWFVTIG